MRVFWNNFFDAMGDDKDEDPRCCYAVRFCYRGRDVQKLWAEYMIKEIIEGFLRFPKEDLLAVIAPRDSGKSTLRERLSEAVGKIEGGRPI